MPKTSVNKNDFSARREYKIRLTREVPYVKSVAETHCLDQPADDQFRLRVLRANPAHALASLLGRQCIHGSSPLYDLADKPASHPENRLAHREIADGFFDRGIGVEFLP